MTPSHPICVLGTGFGALATVRALRQRDRRVPITVIAARPEFHYLPSIIWIPAGLRRGSDLVVPLAPFFERMGVQYVQAEVTGLADGGRTVLTSAGPVPNSALVIATGGRFLRKLPGIEHAITPCEGIAAAEQIRDRLRALDGGALALGFAGNPQEPQSMRGGPIFEFLFGIDTLLRREGRRERFTITFFSPAAEPGARLGPGVVQHLLAEMGRRGIHTHLGHPLVRFEPDKVVTQGGEIASDLTLFMPGLTGNLWFDNAPLPRSPGGLVQADAHCRVPGLERVYVVGDAGSFPGPDWMPKQAHMADLQARAAVPNLLADLRGEPAQASFGAELVCIVDALDSGTLVYRTPSRHFMLPPMKALHWAKRAFEWNYLRQLR
ncbi:MAG: FAD-dependent oxidoreductase [Acidovorax sp.]|uniref:NAD(P)/FAD-dependent oxidoreductase n=1 Tax=Acidovorax sp. TaxID=1872122 RepID=UPI0025BD9740|nr:FAD-dependent oxidoreductase [Acidovorax sp.]MCE1193184.1 FAD-dependent oxidoreductase [Acidovorax sp.]